MIIRFAKCHPDAKIPTRSGDGAGMDIYACFDESELCIAPHATVMIPTKIKSVIENGYFVLIEERGSTGSKGIKKSAGVIDSDYRGEWFIAITNANDIPVYIRKSECTRTSEEDCIIYPYEKAIAQGIVLPVPELTVGEITEDEISLYPTSRGDGKLGSSNK